MGSEDVPGEAKLFCFQRERWHILNYGIVHHQCVIRLVSKEAASFYLAHLPVEFEKNQAFIFRKIIFALF